MRNNNQNSAIKKIIASIIVLLLITLSVYSFTSSDSSSKSELEKEKITLIKELEKMSKDYNTLLEEKNGKSEDLFKAKARIDQLIDSLETTDITLKSLLDLKDRQLEMQSTLKGLVRENKELKQDNGLLVESLNTRKDELYAANKELIAYQNKNTELEDVKEQLHKKVESMSFLNMVDLNARAIKERSSGKLIETNRSRRTDKFEVCYTIAMNPLVREGTKELYVQVIGPRRLVVAPKWTRFKEERFELNYSFISTFNYTNENINKCDYLDIEASKKLKKGNYTVNIYDRNNLITSYKLELK